jgi:hypothetical protein
MLYRNLPVIVLSLAVCALCAAGGAWPVGVLLVALGLLWAYADGRRDAVLICPHCGTRGTVRTRRRSWRTTFAACARCGIHWKIR